ncbi:site-specific integrase [Shimia thalassica]|uniref:tyrosine-type recombinase/integrase n=1 Tax=Shimia thalassica TaxID=1715693 RepID=UPI0026E1A838|nr:site-specific integrase [Shimia thalassica]MDO6520719.1 site-specific integrase [Shimia thalassica]
MKKNKRDGTYFLAAWRGAGPDGKSKVFYERYEGKDGKRGAQKLAVLREAEAANQPTTDNKPRTPFPEYIEQVWLPRNIMGNGDSTVYAKTRITRDLAEQFPDKTVGEISADDFEEMKAALNSRGHAPSTIRNTMKVFKRAMTDAHIWGYTEKRPWEGVKVVKAAKAPPRVVTREEALRAVERLRSEGDDFTADLITVLTYTGLRLSEALGLHWEDIDFERGVIKIWRITVRTNDKKDRIQIKESPKTKAGNRTLPMAQPVRDVLEGRQRTAANPLVFPDRLGRPIYSSRASIPISKAFRDMGLTKKTAHGLRHGAITYMLEKGIPLNQVSRLAGHESSDITAKVYLAWADDDSAIDAMRSVMDD